MARVPEDYVDVHHNVSLIPTWAAHGRSALHATSLAIQLAAVSYTVHVAVRARVPPCDPTTEASVCSDGLHHFHLL